MHQKGASFPTVRGPQIGPKNDQDSWSKNDQKRPDVTHMEVNELFNFLVAKHVSTTVSITFSKQSQNKANVTKIKNFRSTVLH